MYQLTVAELRFMESELDLNDIIQEMHVIATMPDLYHLLVELNAVHSLLGLLSHENSDILLSSPHHCGPLAQKRCMHVSDRILNVSKFELKVRTCAYIYCVVVSVTAPTAKCWLPCFDGFLFYLF